MTVRKLSPDLSMMTHVPLQPHWLAQLPAFQSGNARIVRACMNMLMSAFHGQPSGSLINTPEAIATASHLSVEEAIENMPALTGGWKKSRDTITFEPMATMAARLSADYGDAIRRLQDGVAVAIAAPDLFNSELLPEQGAALAEQVSGKTLSRAMDMLEQTRVKRLLPEGAQITPAIRTLLDDKGFSRDKHDEIWLMFCDHHQSKGTRSANWTSEFRHWLGNKTFYGRLSPESSSVSAPPAATRHTFNFGSRKPVVSVRGEEAEDQAERNLQRAQQTIQALRARSQGNAGAQP